MAALALYEIDTTSHDGVPVYLLDGGMSAEYGVAQSLANLAGGVAHTWEVQAPGMGPNPVLGGPDFLAASLDRTVAYYDDLLGADTEVDTVVLGTGVSSASYVCHALDAPFLPVHFLLSTHTIAGTQEVLDSAGAAGLPAYATLGYDESMPGVAVAWIKLLNLPPQYAAFLRRHRVRHVVVLGATGASGQFGRRPGAHRDRIAPGDTLVTWPDCGSRLDDVWLRQTIADLDGHALEEPPLPIADWESGLADEALGGFAAGLAVLGIAGYLLTAPDYLAMYDVGSVAHTALLAKNKIAVTGIAANPYLLTHPVAETRTGQLPFVYWQLADSAGIVARLHRIAQLCLGLSPADLRTLPVALNVTRNVGGPQHEASLLAALRADGFTEVTPVDSTVDEVYREPSTAPCYRAAQALRASGSAQQIVAWNRALHRLDIGELAAALSRLPGTRVAALPVG
ncbi:hypothetical protein AB0M47_09370 [Hamadaea sp. NPDC051192]|uniref:hypothetical protein n=1 Tax=Hamadaea sp. NPDC051192 TaxID=3154940 RepID=UPI0034394B5D